MNVEIDPKVQRRLNSWKTAQINKGRRAHSVSFRRIFSLAITEWLDRHEDADREDSGKDERFYEQLSDKEKEFVSALVTMLRDPDPQVQGQVSMLALAIEKYTENRQRRAGMNTGLLPVKHQKHGT